MFLFCLLPFVPSSFRLTPGRNNLRESHIRSPGKNGQKVYSFFARQEVLVCGKAERFPGLAET